MLSEVRDPMSKVIDQKDGVAVIAELPGVLNERIGLRTTARRVSISVDTAAQKYGKDIDLPEPVEAPTAKATYRNGVLAVRQRKVT